MFATHTPSGQVDKVSAVVEDMGKRILSLMVIGDTKTIQSGNGMTMTLSL